MRTTAFSTGYFQLHPDVSMNFQMSRWFNGVGEADMLDEMRRIAPASRITPTGSVSF